MNFGRSENFKPLGSSRTHTILFGLSVSARV